MARLDRSEGLATSDPVHIDDLMARMSLEEMVAQTFLVAVNHIEPQSVTDLGIGAILSGGGGNPEPNSPATWQAMVAEYRQAALQSRLGIPILYGVDAVHGHSNVRGATIFPHNIGLGATRDAGLVRRIGRATAVETYATNVRWNYAPTLAVPQDIRWGRTYEGFAEDTELVGTLGQAYIEGLQGEDPTAEFSVLSTAKHYVGDGGTTFGTAESVFPAVPELNIQRTRFLIDQGDTRLSEQALRDIHLAPYLSALKAGALTVMASFSMWNGGRLHAHTYLLTDVLKDELGFPGFVVSDWEGVRDSNPDLYTAVVNCYNAGVDMNMVTSDWETKMGMLFKAVQNGDVPLARLEDAVRRILTVKQLAGLFEEPEYGDRYLSQIGTAEHRSLAREAVVKSAVLLKNDEQTLPLSRTAQRVLVAGAWANDIGLQCGGWTIAWQGKPGAITHGSTILEGIQALAAPHMQIEYELNGEFNGDRAAYGVVCVGELPYAEGLGDRADVTLDAAHVALIERMRAQCDRLVVIVVSGRPLIITEQLDQIDALVAAWLPGSEASALAELLFGHVPFTGKLSYTWPRSMSQVPTAVPKKDGPLFAYGFGLSS